MPPATRARSRSVGRPPLRPDGPLPAVVLVVGPEELLAARAVTHLADRAKVDDPDLVVHRLAPERLGEDPGRLRELLAPSLFGGRTVVVVDGAERLSEEAGTVLAELVATQVDDPEPGVLLVVVHSGRTRAGGDQAVGDRDGDGPAASGGDEDAGGGAGKGGRLVLKACRDVGVAEVDCTPPRGQKAADFVTAEVAAAGGRCEPGAAQALASAVGSDLRALAATASQLVTDGGGLLTVERVEAWSGGRAASPEYVSLKIADAAVAGQAEQALATLRTALLDRVSPVLVTAALARALRQVALVAAAPRGTDPEALARVVGLPAWKLTQVRTTARGWTPRGVHHALGAVARADGEVKGRDGTRDEGYVVERLVLQVVAAREGHG